MSLDPKTAIKLDVTIEDTDFIINALGELPAKTNAFALIMKLRAQALSQVPQEQLVEEPKAE